MTAMSVTKGIVGGFALICAAACSGTSASTGLEQTEEPIVVGSQSTLLTVDSASYRTRIAGLGFYTFTISARFTNTGSGTVWLARRCETDSVPFSTLVRPPADSIPTSMTADDMCLLSTLPGKLPAPIAVQPGTTYRWTITVMSGGTQTQIPVQRATGNFNLKVNALAVRKSGLSLTAADLLSSAMRTSPVFTVLAP